MSKLIYTLIISTFLLISQTHKNYLVKEFFISNHTKIYIVLKEIKTDSIFVLSIEEEFNSKLRKIIKDDTLSLNLNLKYNYDLNSDTNQNFLVCAFYYNGKNRITYIDENIKSGYLPDSCFINKK